MTVKIRLARGGAKKRPYYKIVAANSRDPRDGRFLEKLGTYNPMLASDHPNRITLVEDRIKYWLGVGAQPTDRVIKFLTQRNLITATAQNNNIKKGQPKKKAQERMKEQSDLEVKRLADLEAAREAEMAAAAQAQTDAESKQADSTAATEPTSDSMQTPPTE